jgi:putative flippase GtrA
MMSELEVLTAETSPAGAPVVDVVVPVFNEEATLRRSIVRLQEYLVSRFPLSWVITIADNASTDSTWRLATELAGELAGVRAVRVDGKGRGRALRAAWTSSDAMVVTYMDVDLSTDLNALLPLVAPLVTGHSDVAIGTRLAPGARVVRGAKREMISRGYNALLKATLHNGFSDAQCGFKALRADVAHDLMPLVEDDSWFFDTELLVLAERSGLRIHEVPVDWVDDPDSRVDVIRTATADLKGVLRMVLHPRSAPVAESPRTTPVDGALSGQLARFLSIGVVSTLVFAALFALLARPLGSVGADVVALVACSIANTAANRRVTFALRGRPGRGRHYRIGIALGLVPLALTLLSLAVLTAAGVSSLAVVAAVLTASSAAGALVRFVLLRSWAFGDRR